MVMQVGWGFICGVSEDRERGNAVKKTRWWFQIFFVEDSHFDEHIFQVGCNHQLENHEPLKGHENVMTTEYKATF